MSRKMWNKIFKTKSTKNQSSSGNNLVMPATLLKKCDNQKNNAKRCSIYEEYQQINALNSFNNFSNYYGDNEDVTVTTDTQSGFSGHGGDGERKLASNDDDRGGGGGGDYENHQNKTKDPFNCEMRQTIKSIKSENQQQQQQQQQQHCGDFNKIAMKANCDNNCNKNINNSTENATNSTISVTNTNATGATTTTTTATTPMRHVINIDEMPLPTLMKKKNEQKIENKRDGSTEPFETIAIAAQQQPQQQQQQQPLSTFARVVHTFSLKRQSNKDLSKSLNSNANASGNRNGNGNNSGDKNNKKLSPDPDHQQQSSSGNNIKGNENGNENDKNQIKSNKKQNSLSETRKSKIEAEKLKKSIKKKHKLQKLKSESCDLITEKSENQISIPVNNSKDDFDFGKSLSSSSPKTTEFNSNSDLHRPMNSLNSASLHSLQFQMQASGSDMLAKRPSSSQILIVVSKLELNDQQHHQLHQHQQHNVSINNNNNPNTTTTTITTTNNSINNINNNNNATLNSTNNYYCNNNNNNNNKNNNRKDQNDLIINQPKTNLKHFDCLNDNNNNNSEKNSDSDKTNCFNESQQPKHHHQQQQQRPQQQQQQQQAEEGRAKHEVRRRTIDFISSNRNVYGTNDVYLSTNGDDAQSSMTKRSNDDSTNSLCAVFKTKHFTKIPDLHDFKYNMESSAMTGGDFEGASNLELIPCPTCSRKFNPESLRKHANICQKMATKKRKVFDSSRQRREGTDLAVFLPKNYGLPTPKMKSDINKPSTFAVAPTSTATGSVAGSQVSSPVTPKPPNVASDLTRSNARSSMRSKRGVNDSQSVQGFHSDVLTTPVTSKITSTVSSSVPSTGFSRSSERQSKRKIAPVSEQCPYCERSFGLKAYDRHVEWCKEKSILEARKPTKAENDVAKARWEARTKYRAPNLKTKRSLNRDKYSGLAGDENEDADSPKCDIMSMSSSVASSSKSNEDVSNRVEEESLQVEENGEQVKFEEVNSSHEEIHNKSTFISDSEPDDVKDFREIREIAEEVCDDSIENEELPSATMTSASSVELSTTNSFYYNGDNIMLVTLTRNRPQHNELGSMHAERSRRLPEQNGKRTNDRRSSSVSVRSKGFDDMISIGTNSRLSDESEPPELLLTYHSSEFDVNAEDEEGEEEEVKNTPSSKSITTVHQDIENYEEYEQSRTTVYSHGLQQRPCEWLTNGCNYCVCNEFDNTNSIPPTRQWKPEQVPLPMKFTRPSKRRHARSTSNSRTPMKALPLTVEQSIQLFGTGCFVPPLAITPDSDSMDLDISNDSMFGPQFYVDEIDNSNLRRASQLRIETKPRLRSGLNGEKYDPFLSAKRQLEALCASGSPPSHEPSALSTPSTPAATMPAKMSTSLTLTGSSMPTSSSSPLTQSNLQQQHKHQTQHQPQQHRSRAGSTSHATNLMTSSTATPSTFRRTSSLRGPRRSPLLSSRPLFATNYRPTIQRGLSDEGPISTNFLKPEEYDEMPVRSVCVNDFAITNSPRVIRRDTSLSNRKQNLKLNINNNNENNSLAANTLNADTSKSNNTGLSLDGTNREVSKTDSLAVFLKYESELAKLNQISDASDGPASNVTSIPQTPKTPIEPMDVNKELSTNNNEERTAKSSVNAAVGNTPKTPNDSSAISSPVFTKELKDKSNILSKQNSAKNLKLNQEPETPPPHTSTPLNERKLSKLNTTKLNTPPIVTSPLTSGKDSEFSYTSSNNNNKYAALPVLEPPCVKKHQSLLTKRELEASVRKPSTTSQLPVLNQNWPDPNGSATQQNPRSLNLTAIFNDPKAFSNPTVGVVSSNKERKLSSSSDYIDPKLINKFDNLPVKLSDLKPHIDSSDSSTEQADNNRLQENLVHQRQPEPVSQLTKLLPLNSNMTKTPDTPKPKPPPINTNPTENETPLVSQTQRNSCEGRNLLKRKMRLGRNQFLYDASPEAFDIDSCSADDESTTTPNPRSSVEYEHEDLFKRNSDMFEQMLKNHFAHMQKVHKDFGPPSPPRPMPSFDDFDFEEFLSSFENDDEQFPIFKDCKEFLLNRTSNRKRSMPQTISHHNKENNNNVFQPSHYYNNNKNSSDNNNNNNNNHSSDNCSTNHFQFPSLPTPAHKMSSTNNAACPPLRSSSNETQTSNSGPRDVFLSARSKGTSFHSAGDSDESQQKSKQKREIFISIETEQSDLGRSSMSPDSLRCMLGNPQAVVEVEVDPKDKFSKITSDDDDAASPLPLPALPYSSTPNSAKFGTRQSSFGEPQRLPNVQLNNARNLIQRMQDDFRQTSQEANLRQNLIRSAPTAGMDTTIDSDEMSSLDGYPIKAHMQRHNGGVGSKLSADSAYGSLSRQRSTELGQHHHTRSSSRTRSSSGNRALKCVNPVENQQTKYYGEQVQQYQEPQAYSKYGCGTPTKSGNTGNSAARPRHISNSSSSSSDNSMPPTLNANPNANNFNYQQQQYLSKQVPIQRSSSGNNNSIKDKYHHQYHHHNPQHLATPPGELSGAGDGYALAWSPNAAINGSSNNNNNIITSHSSNHLNSNSNNNNNNSKNNSSHSLTNCAAGDHLSSNSSLMTASMTGKMSKFCHDCGSKFIIEQAKFCMDCGVRRIIL